MNILILGGGQLEVDIFDFMDQAIAERNIEVVISIGGPWPDVARYLQEVCPALPKLIVVSRDKAHISKWSAKFGFIEMLNKRSVDINGVTFAGSEILDERDIPDFSTDPPDVLVLDHSLLAIPFVWKKLYRQAAWTIVAQNRRYKELRVYENQRMPHKPIISSIPGVSVLEIEIEQAVWLKEQVTS